MNNKPAGIIPKIWGPHAWVFLHSITFNYPENPTYEEREAYKIYFEKLSDVLPCDECKESYSRFIKEGVTKLDNDALENRSSLTKWMYYIHNAVNKKLGVTYDVTYEDIVKKYESLRATCGTTLAHESSNQSSQCFAPPDKKSLSYKVDNTKECPIIPIKMAKHFIKYAEMRGLNPKEFEIIKKVKNDCKENHEIWIERNKQCTEILKDIRLNDKQALESNGQWEGFPTVDELKLLLRFSTTLNKNDLTNIIIKLGEKFPNCKCEYKKIYRLVK